MANPDDKNAPKAPPNLRMSTDENRECDSCVYFDRMHCKAFPPLCVDDEWVCDHFKASGKPDDDKYDGKNLQEASGEALKRVRAQRASDEASGK